MTLFIILCPGGSLHSHTVNIFKNKQDGRVLWTRRQRTLGIVRAAPPGGVKGAVQLQLWFFFSSGQEIGFI